MMHSIADVLIDKTPILVAKTSIGDGWRVMTNEGESRISVAWLRANLAYEPATGVFLWKERGMGRVMGKILGSKRMGYLSIKLLGELRYAHRLAWLYVYGEWPSGLLDHIDGNRANNAIKNLRIATSAQNAARRKTTRTVAPSRGVFPHGPGFVARIHHAGKRHYLGYFSTAAAAKVAYEAKAKEIHGEFAHVEPDSSNDPVSASPQRDWLLVASMGFGV